MSISITIESAYEAWLQKEYEMKMQEEYEAWLQEEYQFWLGGDQEWLDDGGYSTQSESEDDNETWVSALESA